MRIERDPSDKESLRFILKSTDPKGTSVFVCEACDAQDRMAWWDQINAMLKNVKDFANALADPQRSARYLQD